MKSNQNTNSRAEAARIVARWLQAGTFPDRQLAVVTADRAFLTEVVYGIARWRGLLDWVIERFVDRPPADRVRALLYVGLYQLLLMDHVAPYAAVNETVNAAKLNRSTRSATGFVNGVLRRAVREAEALRDAIGERPLHVRESHPQALVTRWLQHFDAERTEALCRWNNTRPHVVIHPFAGRIDAAQLAARLNEAGVAATELGEGGFLTVPHGAVVGTLPGYDQGLFSVQDPSTWHAVELLDPRPGEAVLDACAAPGGKTVLIAERMRNEGFLIAADVAAKRIARLRENLERMRLTWVKTVQADFASASFRDCTGPPEYDRILLDVPCTNTGVLRRRPDARWRFSLSTLGDAVQLQRRMVGQAVEKLKRGGVLVYSTCSMEPEEGQELVAEAIANRSDLTVESSWTNVPPAKGMDGGCAVRVRRDL